MWKAYHLIALLLCATLLACQGQETDNKELKSMTAGNIQRDLNTLAISRIYFGHMSVGANIIDGIKELQSRAGKVQLNIVERGVMDKLPDNFLLHSPIGENSKPLSKCIDFKSVIQTELKDKIDYALFKFCYIDFNEETDVEALFADYRKIMDELIADYPDITFIHVTTPLRSVDSGMGVWVREMLGRENRSKISNIQRNRFNQLIYSTYGDQPILDLAAAESTYPDGRRHTFKYLGDEVYYALIEEYTNDGGHLNDIGKRKVAADFIASLAEIIRKDGKP